MIKKSYFSFLAFVSLICGCSDDSGTINDETTIATGMTIKVTSSITKQYSGNIESVRVVEGRNLPSAIAVASKDKAVFFLENDGSGLNYYRNTAMLGYGSLLGQDNELTNSAVYDKERFFLTYTKISKTTSQEITQCGGSLIALEMNEDEQGGGFLYNEIPVGPMPDAVAISPDKRFVLTADEYDGVDTWGKCPLGKGNPSLSIVKMPDSGFTTDLTVSKTIRFTHNAIEQTREPEYIAIASDSNTVAVTLQDSYEVAIFRISEVMAKQEAVVDESIAKFVNIPANAAGIKSWPDGIFAFDYDHKHYFAMAGEGSDSIIIIDDEGNIISNTQITEKEVPTNYPCLEADWFPGTKYSPDSVTVFTLDNKNYVAATLRYAGAVIIYNITDPAHPVFELITRAGEGDIVGNGVCSEEYSKVYPEGIASGVFDNAAYIWVANEGNSSVTSIKVTLK